MKPSARTMAPGKITRRKPIASSSAAGSVGVLPPSTMLAISGTRGASVEAGVHLLERAGRLDEQHVGAGLEIGLGALDGRFEALDGDRVGAGDDQRVSSTARVERGLDLADSSRRRDQLLPSRWPQRLGKVWSSSWIMARPRPARTRARCAGRSGRCRSRCRRRRSAAAPTRSRISASMSATSVSVTRPMSGRPSRV